MKKQLTEKFEFDEEFKLLIILNHEGEEGNNFEIKTDKRRILLEVVEGYNDEKYEVTVEIDYYCYKREDVFQRPEKLNSNEYEFSQDELNEFAYKFKSEWVKSEE